MLSFFYISSQRNQGVEKGLIHCLISNILEKSLVELVTFYESIEIELVCLSLLP